MRMPANLKNAVLVIFLCLAFFALDAHAAIDNAGVMDNALDRYSAAAAGWADVITNAATWLFWTLVLISMVWTFGMMALRRADMAEFFAELVRFTIFTGFFWWLLINGPYFASSIYRSLRQLAGTATGLGHGLSPSGIVDIGFEIFDKVLDQSSFWTPVDSAVGILMALGILIILALVSINMLLLLVAGWILAYGGVFFLGFGGSRWTTDMAINYYKTVLGVAAQLMAMVLLVGIGKTFLDDYYNSMSVGISIKEMGVLLIVTIILLVLVNKIPSLIAGIITGASVGGAGIGSFGAGMALGAAGMATAEAATGGAAIAAGASSAAGGVAAIKAAFSKANENVANGTDILSRFGSPSDEGGLSSSGVDSSIGGTPFAQAAGFASGAQLGGGSSEFSTPNSDSSKNDMAEGKDAKGKVKKGIDQGKASNFEQQGISNGTAKNSGSSDQQTSSPDSPSILASVAKTAGTAGRIAADATANLAQGVTEVAKAKAASMSDAAMERIAETTGGKIAAAINGQSSTDVMDMQVSQQQTTPTFGNNSLASAESIAADPESEVAAFRDRDNNRYIL
ncbi:P-type conjugative transfer protein TrbL [Methylobacter sp. BBA5.1]|uniref:P-type conjugative transfer protein TrbL n=1 Tax=Methylobacter sp. BBA5.1 TaxID=1495064 RepID=UPI000AD99874|nr:P-type conjugative transfer protein TrbL [Methylobacter sp. BBA5.1]